VQFYDGGWPILVQVSAKRPGPADTKQMAEGMEGYFARGKKYALIVIAPPGASLPEAKERRAIAEWANRPLVREQSKRLCVGTAVVLTNSLLRGGMTALMWLWKPAVPVEVVGSLEEALDYCINGLSSASVPLPGPAAALRANVRDWIRHNVTE
jgi:hypothetical protein